MNRDSAKKTPTRLRARLKEATGDTIRAAAEEVLGERGFGARMEDIAERAGVSVGTLYNHFQDREALLLELVRVRRVQLMERLDAELAHVEGRPFREQLQTVLARVFAHFREHARFFAVVMQSELYRGPGVTAQGGTLRELTERLEVLVRRGVEAGEVRREGAELYATLLAGMARALILRAAEPHPGEEPHRGVDVLLQVFLKGIEV